MKRIYWIIVLAVFTIGFSILEQISINTVLSKVENKAYEIEKLINSNDEILTTDLMKEKVEDITKYWTDKENLLSYLINHDHTEEIGVCLDQLNSYLETNKPQEFKEMISLVIYYCKCHKQILIISMQNIL